MNAPIRLNLFVLSLLGCFFSTAVAVDWAEAADVGSTEGKLNGFLQLHHGEFLHGSLVGAMGNDQVAWKCPDFDRPVSIDLSHVRRCDMKYPLRDFQPDCFCVELRGGENVIGRLIGFENAHLTIDSPTLSRLALPIAAVDQIRRWHVPDQILSSGFSGRSQKAERDGFPTWELNGPSLMTRDINVPWLEPISHQDGVRIDLRLSWEGEPQFEIVLGHDAQGKLVADGPRLETWGHSVVAVQEAADRADIVQLDQLSENDHEWCVSIYWDRQRQRMGVFSATGSYLGRFSCLDGGPMLTNGLGFVNYGEKLSLDSLVVSAWDGRFPYPYDEATAGNTSQHEVTGSLLKLDSLQGVAIFRDEEGRDREVPIASLTTFVHQPEQREATRRKIDGKSEPEPASPMQVMLQLSDGSRVTGRIVSGEEGELKLSSISTKVVYRASVSDIISLRMLTPNAVQKTGQENENHRWRLATEYARLDGRPVDSLSLQGETRLFFQPAIAPHAVGILPSAIGSMEWVRPSPNQDFRATTLAEQNRVRVARTESVASIYRTPRGLQLRSGDVLDAIIESIDEEGIVFQSAASTSTKIPHSAMHSVQLKFPPRGEPIDDAKMSRLLTVPRARRDHPPTHLIITTHGDYLRGRLVRLTEESIELEEGATPLKLPRQNIAVIIWLHERGWEEAAETVEDRWDDGFMVHARMRSSGRFTLRPVEIQGGRLIGTSPYLGTLELDLGNVESLEFGPGLAGQMASREPNPWRLTLAKSPLVFDESMVAEGMQGEVLGVQSPLIGQPAPDFQLPNLRNGWWHLGDQRGTIVVLDFWASWCGPCMRAMPEVETMLRELNRPEIQLVAINIEESAERAQNTVERLQLTSLVLLDADGNVAREYRAGAIPMTVIVDRDGVVQHVFIGGSEDSLKAMKKALMELIE